MKANKNLEREFIALTNAKRNDFAAQRFEELLTSGKISNETINEVLENSVHSNQVDITKRICEHKSFPADIIDPLSAYAILSNRPKFIEIFIKNGLLSPDITGIVGFLAKKETITEEDINKIFRKAILQNQWVFSEGIYKDKKISADNINKLLVEAAVVKGHFLFLKKLYTDKRITAEGVNKAFVETSEWGTFGALKLLYKDTSITAKSVNSALVHAADANRLEFIAFLCKDKRITEEAIDVAINHAQRWEYIQLVKSLKKERLNKTSRKNREQLTKNSLTTVRPQPVKSIAKTIRYENLDDIKNLRDSGQISPDELFLRVLVYRPKFAKFLQKDKNITADTINKAFIKYAERLRFLKSVYNFENLSEESIRKASGYTLYKNALKAVKLLYGDDRLDEKLKESYKSVWNIKVKEPYSLASYIIHWGSLNNIKILCDSNIIAPNSIFALAIYWGRLDAVEFVYNNDTLSMNDIRNGFKTAVRRKYPDILEFLGKDERVDKNTINETFAERITQFGYLNFLHNHEKLSDTEWQNYLKTLDLLYNDTRLDEAPREKYKYLMKNLLKSDSGIVYQQPVKSIAKTILCGILDDIKNLRDSGQISPDELFLKVLVYRPKFAEFLQKDKNITADTINKAFIKYAERLRFLKSVYNFENLSGEIIKKASDDTLYGNALRIVRLLTMNSKLSKKLKESYKDVLDIKVKNPRVLASYIIHWGSLNDIKILHSSKIVIPSDIFALAIYWGRLDAVKFTHDNDTLSMDDIRNGFKTAVRRKYPDILEFLGKDERIDKDTINEIFAGKITQFGHLNFLHNHEKLSDTEWQNYLKTLDLLYNDTRLDEAPRKKYKYLMKNLLKSDSGIVYQQPVRSIKKTIQYGNLDDIKNLCDSGQISPDELFLKVLVYRPKFAKFLQKDKNITADTINKAFIKYAERLRFLKSVYNFENLSEESIRKASDHTLYKNALKIVELLYEDDRLDKELKESYKSVWNIKVKEPYSLASHVIQQGTLNDIKILHGSNIVIPSDIFALAIYWGRLDAVEFVYNNDTLSTDDIRNEFKEAARWKHPEVLDFLGKDKRIDKDVVDETFKKRACRFRYLKSLHKHGELSDTRWQNYLKTLDVLYNDIRLDETLRKNYEYLMNSLSKKSESPDIEKTTQKIKNIQQNIQNKIMNLANQGK